MRRALTLIPAVLLVLMAAAPVSAAKPSKEPQGPVHTEEIPYVFGNLPAGSADVTLSQQMQSYWVNFARSGDPNGPGLPHWPAFSASSQSAMYLDAAPHAGPVPNKRKLEVLDAFFGWLRGQGKK